MGKPCSNLAALTKEFLYQVYCVEGRGIISIAREVGCRNGTIVKLLKDYELSFAVTKEWMIEHYVTMQESVDSIAAQLQRDESTVRYYLRQYHIPIRYKKRSRIQIPALNDGEWLYEQYIRQGVSTCKIADDVGCGVSSVQMALKRFGIPTRKVGKPTPSGRKYTYRRAFSHRKRRLIFLRDNHSCQWPGCGSTSNLEIHHIIAASFGGTNDINNGVTLCEACHVKTRGKEDQLAPMFLSIIASHTQEPLT